MADGVVVAGITPTLDPVSRATGNPHRLAANSGLSFQGSNILGLGFTMEPAAARALIDRDPHNAEVLFPYTPSDVFETLPCHPSPAIYAPSAPHLDTSRAISCSPAESA